LFNIGNLAAARALGAVGHKVRSIHAAIPGGVAGAGTPLITSAIRLTPWTCLNGWIHPTRLRGFPLCIPARSTHNRGMNAPPAPDLHHTLKQVLAEHGGVRLAILFGSRATGRARAHSDLDLAVQMSAPLDAADKVALIERIAQATGMPVDLIDLKRVGEPLLGQILKHSIRLIGSDTDYAALISRHLFDAADFLPYRNRILAERRQAWIGR